MTEINNEQLSVGVNIKYMRLFENSKKNDSNITLEIYPSDFNLKREKARENMIINGHIQTHELGTLLSIKGDRLLIDYPIFGTDYMFESDQEANVENWGEMMDNGLYWAPLRMFNKDIYDSFEDIAPDKLKYKYKRFRDRFNGVGKKPCYKTYQKYYIQGTKKIDILTNNFKIKI